MDIITKKITTLIISTSYPINTEITIKNFRLTTFYISISVNDYTSLLEAFYKRIINLTRLSIISSNYNGLSTI